jgi:hypothetical protein
MDNVQNCDSYITLSSSETYRYYFTKQSKHEIHFGVGI